MPITQIDLGAVAVNNCVNICCGGGRGAYYRIYVATNWARLSKWEGDDWLVSVSIHLRLAQSWEDSTPSSSLCSLPLTPSLQPLLLCFFLLQLSSTTLLPLRLQSFRCRGGGGFTFFFILCLTFNLFSLMSIYLPFRC